MAHLKRNEKRTRKQKQDDFLSAYCELGIIVDACKKSKVPRATHYNDWMKDESYVVRFNACGPLALGVLEDEAARRALKGVQKGVYHKGVRVGYNKEFSDTLLIVLLKAKAPHKYRDNYRNEEDGDDDNLGKTVKVTLKLT